MAAIFTQAFEVAGNIAAGDHVEHEMHPLPVGDLADFFNEIVCFVINRMVRADGESGCAFIRRTAGDNHLQSKQLAQFDGHGANPAGAAMNKDGLTFARISAFEYIVPYCHQRFGNGRGFLHR